MVRLGSCHSHEFTPVFGKIRDIDGYESSAESSSEDQCDGGEDAADAEDRDVDGCPESPPDPDTSESEDPAEDVVGAFAGAKDRWKVDGETMKGFYLHSPTSQLFCWDQAKGVLYEYVHDTGDCTAIWAAATPQLNAEVWTVLPLPPTDPASLQTSAMGQSSGTVLCLLHASRSRGPACADFCARIGADEQALEALESLPAAGQAYVLRTFCAPSRDVVSGALRRQIRNYARLGSNVPWAGALEEATLRVPATGAILGRCVPDLAALCWDDGEPLAPAHCRVSCVRGRFSVCDLEAAEDGTLLDGRRVLTEWATLKDGSHLEIGPLRIRVELKPVKEAIEEELPPAIAISEVSSSAGWGASGAAPRRGGWRDAKRAKGAVAAAPAKAEVAEDAEPEDKTDRVRTFSSEAGSMRPSFDFPPRTPAVPFRALPVDIDEAAASETAAATSSSARARRLVKLEHLEAGEDDELSALQEATSAAPIAPCPAPGGRGGLAFWAARRRSPSPAVEVSNPRLPDWVPRTPSPERPPPERTKKRRRR
eukprot:gnl/TRDRNA2_/TRDRNA2_128262_c0_seq1.p1 gnl/TRDRNA2_/TRDRNA2_128262_c0~~gnl/TRDRNA2_/TRDRNA2_128262_c0_seq1.p1  ORF type:complete len:555 (+),score=103.13 gnl/TRDRNA2_/TRDRNA2_128262_c0_seq1:54-1667(+)